MDVKFDALPSRTILRDYLEIRLPDRTNADSAPCMASRTGSFLQCDPGHSDEATKLRGFQLITIPREQETANQWLSGTKWW